MNQKMALRKLFAKYAMLLALLYGFQYAIQYGISYYRISESLNNYDRIWLQAIPVIIVIVGNLITLWFVYKDKRRFQIENRYLEILTVCFRPIGVCILLIQVILKNREEISEKEIFVGD
jgi:hypothetical protein